MTSSAVSTTFNGSSCDFVLADFIEFCQFHHESSVQLDNGHHF